MDVMRQYPFKYNKTYAPQSTSIWGAHFTVHLKPTDATVVRGNIVGVNYGQGMRVFAKNSKRDSQ